MATKSTLQAKDIGLRLFSSSLYRCAVAAIPRCVEPVSTEALTAIVFSTISLEAFLAELATCATYFCARHEEPERVQAFAEVMQEESVDRLPFLAKLQLAKTTLAGRPFNRGTAPFQDVATLVRLRNEIVHSPGAELIRREADGKKPVVSERAILDALRRKGLLDETDYPGSLVSVQTRATAEWACDTTLLLVAALSNDAPPTCGVGAWLQSARLRFHGDRTGTATTSSGEYRQN